MESIITKYEDIGVLENIFSYLSLLLPIIISIHICTIQI